MGFPDYNHFKPPSDVRTDILHWSGVCNGFVPDQAADFQANTLYATPIILPSCVITSLGTDLVTSGAGNLRIGLYDIAHEVSPDTFVQDPTDLTPQRRVINAGISGATGSTTITFTLGRRISAGFYWVAFLADAVKRIRCGAATGDRAVWAALGWTVADAGPTPYGAWSVFRNYSDGLPTLFPSSPMKMSVGPTGRVTFAFS